MSARPYVSRAGEKLAAALEAWTDLLPPLEGMVAADLGSNVGGFVECLLRHGVKKVYAVETGHGLLDWSLRQDARVVVMERTNALYVRLPEKVDLVTVDVGWTRQRHILPAAWRLVRSGGPVITLVKPQYEARPAERRGGVVKPEAREAVLARVREEIHASGGRIIAEMPSPIRGAAGNVEYFWLVYGPHEGT